MTQLNVLQVLILALLGFPASLYQGIARQSGERPPEWANRKDKVRHPHDYGVGNKLFV